MSEITGKAIREFYARIRPGTHMVCLKNTKIPANNGRHVTVETVGKSFLEGLDDDCRPFRLNIPARVGDVLRLGRDTITYELPKGHHCTWQVQP